MQNEMPNNIYIDGSIDYSEKLKAHLDKDNSLNVQVINVTKETRFPEPLDYTHILLLIKTYSHGQESIDYLQKLRKDNPGLKFMLLTTDNENGVVFDVLKLGVNGIVLKDSAICVIVDGIYQVLNGGMPVSAQMTKNLYSMLEEQSERLPQCIYQLTAREKEILEILARGFLYKEIANQLKISMLTVKNHLKNIYRKLEVSNRSEAILKFIGK
jgi:NarL family two-component system response regulator LiaR